MPGLNGTSDNATPAEFLSFLRNLINEYLGDNCPRITKKDTWVTVVNGLTDHLLGTFPLSDVVSWNAMQEKVEMTEVSLEVIRRVFLRVENVDVGSEGITRKLSARLLDLCRVLDVWGENGRSTVGKGCSLRLISKTGRFRLSSRFFDA